MITVQNLSKSYKGERHIAAVNDFNLNLERGRFLAITGRSGSGKSTLLGMLGGISRPSSGAITIDGVDQWRLSDDEHSDFRNRRVGFVFQFASLLPTLRAIDNVALPAIMRGAEDRRQIYARARALLERVGLGERYDSYPSQLSGGEQRRVAIARALINSPELLLADEPTADLDEQTEQEILELLVDIHQAYGLTLIVVTHNPEIAKRADQIIDMRAGRIISTEAGSETHLPVVEPAKARVRDLFDVPAAAAAQERVRLGEGVERFLGKFVLWTVPLVLAVCGINTAIAGYEAKVLEEKAAEQTALEDLAMKDLRAEVQDITFGGGKTYTVSLYLRNTTGTKPIYVMSPTVRGFVQVGSSWQEVPLRPAAGQVSSGQVMKITGNQIYRYTMEPDVPNFAQLFPYYMHVRLSNDMLVSPSSQPKGDLIERSDNYYVYLKPHDADDQAILKKMKFPGKPPIWIPMPPH